MFFVSKYTNVSDINFKGQLSNKEFRMEYSEEAKVLLRHYPV